MCQNTRNMLLLGSQQLWVHQLGAMNRQSGDGAQLYCFLTSSVRGGKNSKEKNGLPSLMEAFILSIIFIVTALCWYICGLCSLGFPNTIAPFYW